MRICTQDELRGHARSHKANEWTQASIATGHTWQCTEQTARTDPYEAPQVSRPSCHPCACANTLQQQYDGNLSQLHSRRALVDGGGRPRPGMGAYTTSTTASFLLYCESSPSMSR